MNGYELLRQAYEKIGDDKKARVMAFLASCDDEDKRTLYDSSAFNEITAGYMVIALRQMCEDGLISTEQLVKIADEFSTTQLFHSSAEDALKARLEGIRGYSGEP